MMYYTFMRSQNIILT